MPLLPPVIIVPQGNDVLLSRWRNANRQDRKSAQKYFIRKLGPGTYLMRANAAVLALLYDLRARYDGNVYVFVVEPLEVEPEFPKEVIEVVKTCRENGRNPLTFL
jgi:hypothetical protein